jgi:predicted GTPase
MGSTYDGLINEVDDMIEEVYEEAAIQLEKRFEQIETFLKKNVKQQ